MKGLDCCICIYDLTRKEIAPARTVIEGFAVCDDHMGYVAQGKRWHSIMEMLPNPLGRT